MPEQISHERGNMPGCLPCSNPARLAEWLAVERARANELGQQSRTLRAAGEEAGKRHLAAVIAGEGHRTLVALQQEHLGLCGDANAYAQRALIIRGDTDRVEAAHPQIAASQQATLFDAEAIDV